MIIFDAVKIFKENPENSRINLKPKIPDFIQISNAGFKIRLK
jgi:hypothetical protein